MVIVTVLAIKTNRVIVTVIAIKTNMVIVTVMGILTDVACSRSFRTRTGY